MPQLPPVKKARLNADAADPPGRPEIDLINSTRIIIIIIIISSSSSSSSSSSCSSSSSSIVRSTVSSIV